MESPTGVYMVYVTIDDDDKANTLITSLLEKKLVACVNKVKDGMYSSYKWDGKVILDESEKLLIMKTSEDRLDDLIATVKKEHPYDCPECIAVPVVKGTQDYLNWVKQETKE